MCCSPVRGVTPARSDWIIASRSLGRSEGAESLSIHDPPGKFDVDVNWFAVVYKRSLGVLEGPLVQDLHGTVRHQAKLPAHNLKTVALPGGVLQKPLEQLPVGAVQRLERVTLVLFVGRLGYLGRFVLAREDVHEKLLGLFSFLFDEAYQLHVEGKHR